jgi:ABC-type multidrug transport system ATPase subunit
MPAIDLRAISATYPGADRPALDRVTLAADHAMVALLGPNGSGKSTLMRVLTGLHPPSAGAVAAPADRRSLGVVFQTPAVDDLLTVRENLHLAASLAGVRKADAVDRTASLARRIGLDEILDRRCGRISGGQRRRADLARALMGRPSVLVLDEPTTGLDIDARARFWSALDALRSEEQLTVLLATHLGDEAERAERVVLMREGRIVADGTPDEIRAPLGALVARAEPRPGAAEAVDRWIEATGRPSRRWSGGAIVAHASADLIDSFPMDAGTIGLSAPTLEDAYLWHTGEPEQTGAAP